MTQTLSQKVKPQTFLQKVTRKTPLDQVGKAVDGDQHLSRTIGLFQLTMLGVGCTIGTGISFVLTTEVPAAGPSIVFSFIAAAIVAGLTALHPDRRRHRRRPGLGRRAGTGGLG